MTTNGVMAVILRHLAKIGSFGTNYIKVDELEVRPIGLYCQQQKCSP